MGMHPSAEDWAEVDSHEDWFLHDINGNRLVHNYWGWYCMDVGNTGWRSQYANLVKDKLGNSLFDGVFADDTWDTFNYYRWNVPKEQIPADIGPRWHDDMLGMVSFVKETIGDKLLIVNTSNNDEYVYACDGKMEEPFVHASSWSFDDFGNNYDWKGVVDALKNISQAGKYYLAHSSTKIPENPTEAEFDKVRDIMIYSLASYLLGTGGEKATFGFLNIKSPSGSFGYYPEFNISLGSPINDYYLLASVFSRDFERGKVLVNPTSSSHTVDLDSEYKTLDGQTASNVTLDAHSGIVLLRP